MTINIHEGDWPRRRKDADIATLTEPGWRASRRLGDRHWLDIVRLGNRERWVVQNPYAKMQPRELQRWVVKASDAAARGKTIQLGCTYA